MAVLQRTPVRVGIFFALLLVVVVAQNAAASLAPTGTSAQTGRMIGRAGFAYLSGIRTFAAAVLWNRLDPQFDAYYHDKQLSENTQLLPAFRLIQALDPQFIQPYYDGAWIIARHGDRKTAFDLAREGIAENPESGLLRSSYIQLMFLDDKERHRDEAVAQADAGTNESMFWNDDAEKLEGYAVFAAAYRVAGLRDKADAARAVVTSLAGAAAEESIGGAGHDHDGDGTPDH